METSLPSSKRTPKAEKIYLKTQIFEFETTAERGTLGVHTASHQELSVPDTSSLYASQGEEVDGDGKATLKCIVVVLEEHSKVEVESSEGVEVIKMPQSIKTFITIGRRELWNNSCKLYPMIHKSGPVMSSSDYMV